jgi:sugar lactone lactonase YvrE
LKKQEYKVLAIKTKILLEGLAFGESPRWHDGRLWFSDMYAHQVMAVDMDGNFEVIVKVPGRPSGLGWLPDGRLLVVSMTDKRLLRLDPDGLTEVADLSGFASGICNDMVVDSLGRAYIGNAGLDTDLEKHKVGPAEIILVNPEGDMRVVANGMVFPNGAVITPDERALIVAESTNSRLTAFDIESDGSLLERRVWAQLEDGVHPDGICLDAEEAVWLADAGNEVIRVREGGEITHRIGAHAYACMLGGPDRRTLFIMTAGTFLPNEARARLSGRVEIAEVDVPGAGLP